MRKVLVNAADVLACCGSRLAHEVGPRVFQCLEGTTAAVYCRAEEVSLDPAVKAFEREANVFAAELPMPEDEVRRAWAGSVAECAERFGASEEAMGWRLCTFGLVDAPAKLRLAS